MEKLNKSCCTPSRLGQREMKVRSSESTGQASKNKLDSREMILLSGGEFLMGTNDKTGFPADGEGPVRKVQIDPFYIDATAVTNAKYKDFTKKTGYRTDSERYAWSFVFNLFVSEETKKTVRGVVADAPWWWAVPGANWAHPEGPDSDIKDRLDHPVVHISWNDAVAYCKWAGNRLPTEAEWEYAARGGLEQMRFVWGDELLVEGKHMCNIWQGRFPDFNSADDGYVGTSPARSFPANGYGLFNMAGNVWEWCEDWFSPTFHVKGPRVNPRGPLKGTAKVMRGGSYLCHESYCNRYRVAARSSNTIDSATGNLGFRCVCDVI